MKILAVRHTRVEVPKGICYGASDVPLSRTASVEIRSVVDQLSGLHFDAVYSSPLNRCTALSQALSSHLEGEPIFRVDTRLSELNFGVWEMQSWDSVFQDPEGKRWFSDYLHERCPAGSSYLEMQQSVRLFLDELMQYPFRQVLLVTHAGVIRTLMHLLQQMSSSEAFNLPVDYGQICTFESPSNLNSIFVL